MRWKWLLGIDITQPAVDGFRSRLGQPRRKKWVGLELFTVSGTAAVRGEIGLEDSKAGLKISLAFSAGQPVTY
jgi:hypothetical protein